MPRRTVGDAQGTSSGLSSVRIYDSNGNPIVTSSGSLPTYLTGDDGSVIDWGGSNAGNPLGVYILGSKSGGGFNIAPAELNPITGEIGLNVNVMPYGDPIEVKGQLQNNNLAPGTDNIGALTAVANAAAPTRTEGRLGTLRTTLTGDLAVTLDGESVAVTGTQTDALTDTELRASPVPVSGTVTANAGTNLNTSLLALESGGNLATIAGKDFATQTTLAALLTELQAKADLTETQPISSVSLTPGTDATHLGKAEDAVHLSGDVGVMALGVRNDGGDVKSDSNGDYEPIPVGSFGGKAGVDVHIVGDGDKFCRGVSVEGATTTGLEPVLVGLEDPSGNLQNFQGDASKNLKAVLAANSGVDIGDVDILSLPNEGQQTMANSISVAVASNQTAIEQQGDAAHGAAVAGNPILGGGEARTTNPTAVTDGQAVRRMHDKVGRQVASHVHVRDLETASTTTISTTTETTILSAGGAGVFHDLKAITFANTSATGTRVDIRDTNSGSVRFSFYLPANDTRGAVFHQPFRQTTANTNWRATLGTAVTDVRIMVQAVKNI